MASFTAKPDPQQWPVGTTIQLYAKPRVPWREEGKPPGAEVTSAVVEAEGAQSKATFTGLTEGADYIGWASANTYLKIHVPTSSTSAVSEARVKELIAEEAVSAVSPTFTGTPKAPTPAEGDNSTKLATSAYADRAVATEAGLRGTAEALKAPLANPALTGVPKAPTAAPATNTTQLATTAYADAIGALAPLKANNLSDLPNAATARANLGLGTAATTAATAYEVAGAAATAQAAAEAASGLHLKEHAVVNTNATTGIVNAMHPVDDTAESRPIKLPTGAAEGSRIGFEKTSAEPHEVAVEGNIRGEAAQTIKLRLQRQTILFVADSAGSWWPIAMYVPLATLSTDYVLRTISVPASVAPGNALLAEWKIKLHGTEKRTIVSARIRTSSGTIKVKVARGEAGATEIAAYKELKGAEAEELVESEQALSDKDRVTVTSSGESTCKGLFLDIWEKVEK